MMPAVKSTLRRVKQATAASACKTVPIRAWSFLVGTPLLLPLYHLVSDAQVTHVRHLYRFRNVREFERDLEFLLHHFEPVGLDAVVRYTHQPRSIRRPSFHLTFDDGFRECHEIVAPLLRRKGIPATFFLTTAFLDRGGMAHHNKISVLIDRIASGVSEQILQAIGEVLAPVGKQPDLSSRILAIPYADDTKVDQIAIILEFDFNNYIKSVRPHLNSAQVYDLIKQGFTIGAHSCTHPLYSDISLPEQLAQTEQSMENIASRFGTQARAFAFPHNDEGVTPQFFEHVFRPGGLDVAFGTNGMNRHFHPRNVERVVMERNPPEAAAIVLAEYWRAFRNRMRMG